MGPNLRKYLVGKLVFLFFTTALVIGPAPGAASVPRGQTTSFTVNSTTDARDANPGDGVCEIAPGNGVCTLRAAIQETNALAGADAIILPSGVYTLTIAGVGEDRAAFGDLDIINDLTLTGAEAASTVVDGNGLDRVFHIVNTNVVMEIAGVTIQNGNTQPAQENGGGVVNSGGTLRLFHSTVRGNSARLGGGIFSNGALRLFHSTVSDNSANHNGGGIFNDDALTLIHSTVRGNSARTSGGGIYNWYYAPLTLIHSTVHGNSARTSGGGIYNNQGFLSLTRSTISDNSASSGGGIVNSCCGGTLSLTHSTVSDNSANGSGGGIINSGGILSLTLSTVSSNSADGSGGGIVIDGRHSFTSNLSNVTITDNTADGDGNGGGDGGGIFNQVGLVNVKNTIIAGNHDNSLAIQYRDCSTTRPLDSYGYNLIEDITGCLIGGDTTGNLTGVSPNLGSLHDNGGATFTHALLPGSPAIDAGNPAGCADHEGITLLTDQRGFLRIQDGDGDNSKVCDIGAYELGSSLPTYVYLSLVYK